MTLKHVRSHSPRDYLRKIFTSLISTDSEGPRLSFVADSMQKGSLSWCVTVVQGHPNSIAISFDDLERDQLHGL